MQDERSNWKFIMHAWCWQHQDPLYLSIHQSEATSNYISWSDAISNVRNYKSSNTNIPIGTTNIPIKFVELRSASNYQFLRITNGEGNGTPLQNSCLENHMEGGAWWAAVHGVAKSRTRLSDFTFTFHFHALEKEMATHSCVLAWRIPGTGEPGRLPSMGSHRVGHDWSNLAAAAAA